MFPNREVLRQRLALSTDQCSMDHVSSSNSVDATARKLCMGLAPRQKIPVLVPLHSQMHSCPMWNDVSSPAAG